MIGTSITGHFSYNSSLADRVDGLEVQRNEVSHILIWRAMIAHPLSDLYSVSTSALYHFDRENKELIHANDRSYSSLFHLANLLDGLSIHQLPGNIILY